MKIDKSKPVMVTGANGFLGSWIVKQLLEQGISVNAAIRSLKEDKIKHLKNITPQNNAQLHFFQADLLEDGSYRDAMGNYELVIHTASPFKLNAKDPQKELIDPAVKGVENILNSINKTSSVKRVVMTSSCVAMYTDVSETTNNPIDESRWNSTASLTNQPYALSKTLAEKKAWEVHKSQDSWDLICINPPFILGPPIPTHLASSLSLDFIKMLGKGKMKYGVPNLGRGMVDVRDLAKIHIQAAFSPNAKGRYIAAAHSTNFLELSKTLSAKYGAVYPLPKRVIPKWIFMLVGKRINPAFTKPFIQNNIDQCFLFNNSKVKTDLHIKFQSIKETMEASFQAMIELKVF